MSTQTLTDQVTPLSCPVVSQKLAGKGDLRQEDMVGWGASKKVGVEEGTKKAGKTKGFG